MDSVGVGSDGFWTDIVTRTSKEETNPTPVPYSALSVTTYGFSSHTHISMCPFDSLDEWLCAKVSSLSLDMEIYTEYTKGLLQDEDIALSNRIQNVIDTLSAASDGSLTKAELDIHLNSAEMQAQVQHIFEKEAEFLKQQQLQQKQRIETENKRLREKEIDRAQIAQIQEKQKLAARQFLSEEELAQKDKIVSQYGFSELSEYDEDGNLVQTGIKQGTGNMLNVEKNANKQRVQQAQAQIRETMKAEHAKKVLREKELLEKDRIRKDKVKRRTQKREKQRGCG